MIRCIVNLRVPILFAVAFWLSLAAFSQSEDPNAGNTHSGQYVSGLTTGRAQSIVGGVIALIGLFVGWRARSWRYSRSWTVTAIVLGAVALVLSAIHLFNTTGSFGTGGGKAGAIVAIALGVLCIVMNSVRLRSKH